MQEQARKREEGRPAIVAGGRLKSRARRRKRAAHAKERSTS
jgi:hypothetical protein